MAEVRRHDERWFTVLHNGVDRLTEHIDRFCKGEYGRKCDLYRAFVAKKDPRSYDEASKQYRETGAELIEAVRDALTDAEEFVRFEFSGEGYRFTLTLVPGDARAYLEDVLPAEEIDRVRDTDTVVIGDVEEGGPDMLKQFFDRL